MEDDAEFRLDAPVHMEWRQVRLHLGDRRWHEVLGDEEPHEDADSDRPVLRSTFGEGNKVGGGDQVADAGLKLASQSFWTTLVKISRLRAESRSTGGLRARCSKRGAATGRQSGQDRRRILVQFNRGLSDSFRVNGRLQREKR